MRFLNTMACVLAISWGGASLAAPVTPSFDAFEDLPQATFGGSGIPTSPTAITTFEVGQGSQTSNTVTLGMSATQRFFNPPLTNDGNGTYFALTGANNGGPGDPSSTVGALWNFNFFVSIEGPGGLSLSDLGLNLLYDFDPGVNTDESDLGSLNQDTLFVIGSALDPNVIEGSQNLNFSYLDVPLPPFVSPPSFPSFDPNAAGQYSFLLSAGNFGEQVSINVETAPIPLPAGFVLMISGLGGLVALRRSRKRA